MKKHGNNITIIAVVVSLFTVCFLLMISIVALLVPDSPLFYEPYDDGLDLSYYALDLTQNETDFSYKIDIISRDGKKVPTKDSYLDIDQLMDYDQTESLSVAEYGSTKNFVTPIHYYDFEYERIPQEINFSITFSTSVTYVDSDADKHLSKGDYFIIKIIDLDKNEPYNLSQYHDEIHFQILTEDDSCSRITLNERPPGPDEPVFMSETVSAEGVAICPIIFTTICLILITFQFYFLSKLLKNRKDIT